MKRTCDCCGKIYNARPYKLRAGRGRFCSHICSRRTPAERFWSNVDKNGPTQQHVPHLGPCWEWQGYRIRGYGHLRTDLGPEYAHRFSWRIHHEPTDQFVLHKCDNPACVRPDHLFIGDNQLNRDDCKAKGRMNSRRGDSHGSRKLNSTQVQKIRTDPRDNVTLATVFRLSRGHVWKIRNGSCWKPEPSQSSQGK